MDIDESAVPHGIQMAKPCHELFRALQITQEKHIRLMKSAKGRLLETGTALLSNYSEYTTFSYRDRCITFLTGKRLKKYRSIKKWQHGYLVVECENWDKTIEEDYIDLIPILKNLFIDPNTFLDSIKEVQLSYAD